jgi:hypothetical protein
VVVQRGEEAREVVHLVANVGGRGQAKARPSV